MKDFLKNWSEKEKIENMKRPKGRLLKLNPYTISGYGTSNMKCSINELAGLKAGDKVYQEVMDNGIVLLIPEKIYLQEQGNE